MRNIALVVMLGLTACGGNGGGGTPTPTPTPVNAAPVFTSAATASVAENGTGVQYQAAATDANGDAITFSIAGGADAARFGITTGGALSFSAIPNYDLPADANGDNIYEVQLRASDGTLSNTLNLQITVTNSVEGIRVRRILGALWEPFFAAPDPRDSGRLLLGSHGGRAYLIYPATGGRADYTGPSGGSGAGNQEMGLLAVAGFPNPASSRWIMVHRTQTDFSSEIIEFNIDTRIQRQIMVIPHRAGSPNNYGGWMAFGPDGFLYIATGDGGGLGDPDNNAQNPNSLLGKILRVKVEGTGGSTSFSPAPGNPFIGGGGNPFVFAMGLQNPRRAAFDGNRLIITDLSEVGFEEVNLMPLDQPGINFGWPYLDGTTAYKGTAPSGLTPPVLLYPHSAGPWRADSDIGSIVGGFVYRGPIASLQGHYVFADYWFENVYSIPVSSFVQGQTLPFTSVERRTADFRPDAGTSLQQITGFGMDGAGNLYVLDLLGGEIYIVEPR
ncbi:PQQ-dependent sugar dehydrogenase [Sphingomonas sp. BT-65]|uniref:PQQ-dependent sugar dehydrogenase n=1 Tax=Sphingomonas sp. BT-65 TaxID=2989821 RepID=UPI002235979F|nr:PQQ-dependent sugar dehydrogenase [Sphingomonas sp. BT-65]MCW4460453.1 PQQ-dependent sugar dehydrogenase [Sphingomonas sp. BT-65]